MHQLGDAVKENWVVQLRYYDQSEAKNSNNEDTDSSSSCAIRVLGWSGTATGAEVL